jgi:Na+/pantothenate symporter
LEQRLSHRSSSKQLVEPVEVIAALVVVQQTQPFHQTIWLNVLTMGTVEQPFVQ